MPRENIQDRRSGHEVQVTWGEHLDVRIATLLNPQTSTSPHSLLELMLFEYLNGPELIDAVQALNTPDGRPVIIVKQVSVGGRIIDLQDGEGAALGHSMWRGIHMELDRADINKLIVVLRRARDRVFGKDE